MNGATESFSFWFNERKPAHPGCDCVGEKKIFFANLFSFSFFFHRSFLSRYQSFWHFFITETHLGTQFGGVLSTSQAAKYLVGVGFEFDDIRSNFDIFLLFLCFFEMSKGALALDSRQTIVQCHNNYPVTRLTITFVLHKRQSFSFLSPNYFFLLSKGVNLEINFDFTLNLITKFYRLRSRNIFRLIDVFY
jgi:hypothetical protein